MTPWTTLARGTTALFLVLAILLAATLFTVKARVQDVAERAEALAVAIETERRAIHVLRAEWSHLANPERLGRLAGRHLALEPLRPDQLASFEVLPAPAIAAYALASPPEPVPGVPGVTADGLSALRNARP